MHHALDSGDAPGLMPRAVHDAGVKLWNAGGVGLAAQPDGGITGDLYQPDALLDGVQC